MTYLLIYAIFGLLSSLMVGSGQYKVFGNSVFKDWQWYLALILGGLLWPIVWIYLINTIARW